MTPDWSGSHRFVPAIGLAGACAVAALSPIGEGDGPILCPYRVVTGHWCPGCGGTRAIRSLTRGDVDTAISLNPWAIVVLIQAVILTAFLAAIPDSTLQWFRANQERLLLSNVAIAAASWIV